MVELECQMQCHRAAPVIHIGAEIAITRVDNLFLTSRQHFPHHFTYETNN